MKLFKEELKKVEAFVFDVDGVFSSHVMNISPAGDLIRTSCTKDGYALMYCVKEVDSRRRKELHLAAVLVNNFPNFLYMLAEKRLMEHDLNFDLLRPLIRETAAKVMHMRPEEAQTGPARRNDESVLGMHRALLKDDRPLLEVYSLLSEAIRTWYTEKEETVKVAEKSKTEDGMLTLW